jgi:hypothetical protein
MVGKVWTIGKSCRVQFKECNAARKFVWVQLCGDGCELYKTGALDLILSSVGLTAAHLSTFGKTEDCR